MKEANIHYYIPKNEKELEELVEKPIGVRITSAWKFPQQMIYSGINEGVCEFLCQARIVPSRGDDEYEEDCKDYPTNIIRGWRSQIRYMDFTENGVILNTRGFDYIRYEDYKLKSPDYQKKVELLKINELWEEPQD